LYLQPLGRCFLLDGLFYGRDEKKEQINIRQKESRRDRKKPREAFLSYLSPASSGISLLRSLKYVKAKKD